MRQRTARAATMGRPALAIVAAVAGLLGLLAGCGARVVELPATDTLVLPTVAPVPADPGESPQLDALVERDVSGLVPDEVAEASLLAPALAALRNAVPGATEATRLSVYSDSVYLTVIDPTNRGRSISISYSDGSVYISEPATVDDEAFSLDGIDLSVPGAVAAGIARRFPSMRVDSIDLRRGLSYGFGLVWYLDVSDAAGGLATVFVELDGTVVAVDES